MICIDGDDEWHGRHQDCVQGQRCCCNNSGRFDLGVDYVHCPWYASSDFTMICNKTSSALPSNPSEAQAAQQSQVTWHVKKLLRNPTASCSITRSWAFFTNYNCGNFLGLELSHHWSQNTWHVVFSSREEGSCSFDRKVLKWQLPNAKGHVDSQHQRVSTTDLITKAHPAQKTPPKKVVVMGKSKNEGSSVCEWGSQPGRAAPLGRGSTALNLSNCHLLVPPSTPSTSF